jgi:DNA-binding PadR family transcriptional regulator
MLSAVERLRFRPDALDDLEWDGLIVVRMSGDERMVGITEAGEAWLRQHRDVTEPNGEVGA